MRIDIVVEPGDLFATPQADVDVEASGQTFAVALRSALAEAFPEARLKVWFSSTAVRSEERLEVHWDEGEADDEARTAETDRVAERVEALVGRVRDGGDWIVRVA